MKIPFFTHEKYRQVSFDSPLQIPPSVYVLVYNDEGILQKQVAPIDYILNDVGDTIAISVLTDFKNGFIIIK